MNLSQPAPSQRGFTLLEVMVAGTIASMVGLALLETLLTVVEMAHHTTDLVLLNQESRNVFDLAAEGGVVAEGTSIPGYWGRATDPVSANELRVTNQQLLLGPAAGPNLISTAWPTVNIPCTGQGKPIPACLGPGLTLQAQGFVSGVTRETSRSLDGASAEITFSLAIPYAIPNAGSAVRSPWSYQSSFWTLFATLVEP
ncbi:MAG: prepilin-type N-terminal cleavage/methylation domain-containing protein [Magnetococcales bacterium]|nr:prepilin-type N-terminal cleavage/methylation domain-containing protein [Magnetococcales bacterium]MBF0322295.1 prepilin-type N-terminal cleavage/methylation domain-containing protein [Magnetococcales bacterium]